ncbi:MAG: right-handed parallel beta-helix repeat-containing protein [Candidatus Thorarchaeota archaeon]
MRIRITTTIFLILVFSIPASLAGVSIANSASTQVSSTLSQIAHDSVIITSDASWISQGWPGSGTPEDPYRIVSLWISSEANWGIWVSNTNAHFVVSNCLISEGPDEGIHLQNCHNATIEDTTITGLPDGIVVEDTSYLTIDNCESTSTNYGMFLDGVSIATISDSRFSGDFVACEIVDSLVMFNNNNITNSDTGILAEGLIAGQFYNNTFNNCATYGLDLEDSSLACIIMNNSFTGSKTGGLLLRRTSTMVVMGNDFTFCGLTVIGSELSHYFHSVLSNVVNGKPLAYNMGLNNQEFLADDYGQLYFISCEAITVRGGSITGTQRAVSFTFSTGCLLDNVTITACKVGVDINKSNLTDVQNSLIRSCGYGILVFSESYNITIINNEVSYSDEYGVFINSGALNCLIYNNTFVENEYGLRDYAVGNMWDDGIGLGNIYDDYGGTGYYSIPGDGGAVDHYPRMLEVTPLGGLDPIFILSLAVTGIVVVVVLIFVMKLWKRPGV